MPENRSHVRRGLFFSFEGIDGSGKSTQARLLAEALKRLGERFVSVREPGGTPVGEQVRAILLDPASQITDRAEALLFASARAQLVETIIEPALAVGIHVIADRYVDSTSAYQGGGRDLGRSLDAVSEFATNGLMPDRTYLVSLSLESAEERLTTRGADRMEMSPTDVRERTATVYDRLASGSEVRIFAIDGRLAIADIHHLILSDALTWIQSAGTRA